MPKHILDGAVRKEAENNLNQFQKQNLPSFLFSLAEKLSNDEKPPESRRRLAGKILKNDLAMDPTFKAQIKASLLRTLSSPYPYARSTASQIIAKVAGIELPHKQWPELIGSLLSNVHQLPSSTKQATLETLGYICQEVSPDVLDQDHVNI
ncbi:hypothetical protein TSUD_340250 [Trifolium subterraneum]|uniref:Importin N-terminal domain-containing protein n=1 Tax=Trifolium subterraneum TaxID=3900 RepID=A0A2Z6LN97_TRISU|nr:hypothetical protein TSUD_340250 [Trifolium subterraneum]